MVELLEAVLLEETVIELLAPSERPEENPVRILDVDGRALWFTGAGRGGRQGIPFRQMMPTNSTVPSPPALEHLIEMPTMPTVSFVLRTKVPSGPGKTSSATLVRLSNR
jgi:hypothetical protein